MYLSKRSGGMNNLKHDGGGIDDKEASIRRRHPIEVGIDEEETLMRRTHELGGGINEEEVPMRSRYR